MPRGNRREESWIAEYYDGQTSNGEKKKEEEKKRAVKRALDKPCTVPLLPFHHSRTSRIRRLDKLAERKPHGRQEEEGKRVYETEEKADKKQGSSCDEEGNSLNFLN